LALIMLIINNTTILIKYVNTIPTTVTVPLNTCATIEALVDPYSPLGIKVVTPVKYLFVPTPKYVVAEACGTVKLVIDTWRSLAPIQPIYLEQRRFRVPGTRIIELNYSAAILSFESVDDAEVVGDYVYILERRPGHVHAVAYGRYVELRGTGVANVTIVKIGAGGLWLALPWLGTEIVGRYRINISLPLFTPNQSIYLVKPVLYYKRVQLNASGCVISAQLVNRSIKIVTDGGSAILRVASIPPIPFNVTGLEIDSATVLLRTGEEIEPKDFELVDHNGNIYGRCLINLIRTPLEWIMLYWNHPYPYWNKFLL